MSKTTREKRKKGKVVWPNINLFYFSFFVFLLPINKMNLQPMDACMGMLCTSIKDDYHPNFFFFQLFNNFTFFLLQKRVDGDPTRKPYRKQWRNMSWKISSTRWILFCVCTTRSPSQREKFGSPGIVLTNIDICVCSCHKLQGEGSD